MPGCEVCFTLDCYCVCNQSASAHKSIPAFFKHVFSHETSSNKDRIRSRQSLEGGGRRSDYNFHRWHTQTFRVRQDSIHSVLSLLKRDAGAGGVSPHPFDTNCPRACTHVP